MWPKTQVSKLLNLPLPLIQAPMAGGATTPQLVAAVSNAGGLGSFAAGYLQADEIRKAIHAIYKLTDQPFAVNVFIPEKHHATSEQIEQERKILQTICVELNFQINPVKPPYAPNFEEQLAVLIEEKIPVLSFTFGMLDKKWIEIFKKNHVILIGTATTVEEAKLLEKNGIDAIVAQGKEAGGHRGTFIGNAEDALFSTQDLITLFAKQIHIPIIAAGGIMNATDIVAALKLGASHVQMGTAFLCCKESGAHPLHKKLLLTADKDKTTLTRAFSGKLARGIQNKFITQMEKYKKEILDYPIQNTLTSSMRKEAARQNNADYMSMFAGQRGYLCKEMVAKELIEEIYQGMHLCENNP